MSAIEKQAVYMTYNHQGFYMLVITQLAQIPLPTVERPQSPTVYSSV